MAMRGGGLPGRLDLVVLRVMMAPGVRSPTASSNSPP